MVERLTLLSASSILLTCGRASSSLHAMLKGKLILRCEAAVANDFLVVIARQTTKGTMGFNLKSITSITVSRPIKTFYQLRSPVAQAPAYISYQSILASQSNLFTCRGANRLGRVYWIEVYIRRHVWIFLWTSTHTWRRLSHVLWIQTGPMLDDICDTSLNILRHVERRLWRLSNPGARCSVYVIRPPSLHITTHVWRSRSIFLFFANFSF